MPEEPTGTQKMPSDEEIKNKRAEKLREEIGELKQQLAEIGLYRNKWNNYIYHIDGINKELAGGKLEPGMEALKHKELKHCQDTLKQIGEDCHAKYGVTNSRRLVGKAHDCMEEIVKKQKRLDVLEGKPYRFGQHGEQTQQGQNDHMQQRVKVVAEPNAEYMKQQEEHFEPVQLPEGQGQNQDTMLKVTEFHSSREAALREFNSKGKDQPEQGHNRSSRQK